MCTTIRENRHNSDCGGTRKGLAARVVFVYMGSCCLTVLVDILRESLDHPSFNSIMARLSGPTP